jgi:hypothetical protein
MDSRRHFESPSLVVRSLTPLQESETLDESIIFESRPHIGGNQFIAVGFAVLARPTAMKRIILLVKRVSLKRAVLWLS